MKLPINPETCNVSNIHKNVSAVAMFEIGNVHFTPGSRDFAEFTRESNDILNLFRTFLHITDVGLQIALETYRVAINSTPSVPVPMQPRFGGGVRSNPLMAQTQNSVDAFARESGVGTHAPAPSPAVLKPMVSVIVEAITLNEEHETSENIYTYGFSEFLRSALVDDFSGYRVWILYKHTEADIVKQALDVCYNRESSSPSLSKLYTSIATNAKKHAEKFCNGFDVNMEHRNIVFSEYIIEPQNVASIVGLYCGNISSEIQERNSAVHILNYVFTQYVKCSFDSEKISPSQVLGASREYYVLNNRSIVFPKPSYMYRITLDMLGKCIRNLLFFPVPRKDSSNLSSEKYQQVLMELSDGIDDANDGEIVNAWNNAIEDVERIDSASNRMGTITVPGGATYTLNPSGRESSSETIRRHSLVGQPLVYDSEMFDCSSDADLLDDEEEDDESDSRNSCEALVAHRGGGGNISTQLIDAGNNTVSIPLCGGGSLQMKIPPVAWFTDVGKMKAIQNCMESSFRIRRRAAALENSRSVIPRKQIEVDTRSQRAGTTDMSLTHTWFTTNRMVQTRKSKYVQDIEAIEKAFRSTLKNAENELHENSTPEQIEEFETFKAELTRKCIAEKRVVFIIATRDMFKPIATNVFSTISSISKNMKNIIEFARSGGQDLTNVSIHGANALTFVSNELHLDGWQSFFMNQSFFLANYPGGSLNRDQICAWYLMALVYPGTYDPFSVYNNSNDVVLLRGTPSVGKSHVIACFKKALIPNTTKNMGSSSSNARLTNSVNLNDIFTTDEFVFPKSEDVDELKQFLSEGLLTKSRCVSEKIKEIDAMGERKMSTFSTKNFVSYNSFCVLAATNREKHEIDPALLSRFLILNMLSVNNDIKINGMNSKVLSGQEECQHNYMRFIQCCVARILTMVGSVIPQIETSGTDNLFKRVNSALEEEEHILLSYRAQHRILRMTRLLCVTATVIDQFLCHTGRFFGQSATDERLVELSPFLYTKTEHLVFVLGLYQRTMKKDIDPIVANFILKKHAENVREKKRRTGQSQSVSSLFRSMTDEEFEHSGASDSYAGGSVYSSFGGVDVTGSTSCPKPLVHGTNTIDFSAIQKEMEKTKDKKERRQLLKTSLRWFIKLVVVKQVAKRPRQGSNTQQKTHMNSVSSFGSSPFAISDSASSGSSDTSGSVDAMQIDASPLPKLPPLVHQGIAKTTSGMSGTDLKSDMYKQLLVTKNEDYPPIDIAMELLLDPVTNTVSFNKAGVQYRYSILRHNQDFESLSNNTKRQGQFLAYDMCDVYASLSVASRSKPASTNDDCEQGKLFDYIVYPRGIEDLLTRANTELHLIQKNKKKDLMQGVIKEWRKAYHVGKRYRFDEHTLTEVEDVGEEKQRPTVCFLTNHGVSFDWPNAKDKGGVPQDPILFNRSFLEKVRQNQIPIKHILDRILKSIGDPSKHYLWGNCNTETGSLEKIVLGLDSNQYNEPVTCEIATVCEGGNGTAAIASGAPRGDQETEAFYGRGEEMVPMVASENARESVSMDQEPYYITTNNRMSDKVMLEVMASSNPSYRDRERYEPLISDNKIEIFKGTLNENAMATRLENLFMNGDPIDTRRLLEQASLSSTFNRKTRMSPGGVCRHTVEFKSKTLFYLGYAIPPVYLLLVPGGRSIFSKYIFPQNSSELVYPRNLYSSQPRVPSLSSSTSSTSSSPESASLNSESSISAATTHYVEGNEEMSNDILRQHMQHLLNARLTNPFFEAFRTKREALDASTLFYSHHWVEGNYPLLESRTNNHSALDNNDNSDNNCSAITSPVVPPLIDLPMRKTDLVFSASEQRNIWLWEYMNITREEYYALQNSELVADAFTTLANVKLSLFGVNVVDYETIYSCAKKSDNANKIILMYRKLMSTHNTAPIARMLIKETRDVTKTYSHRKNALVESGRIVRKRKGVDPNKLTHLFQNDNIHKRLKTVDTADIAGSNRVGNFNSSTQRFQHHLQKNQQRQMSRTQLLSGTGIPSVNISASVAQYEKLNQSERKLLDKLLGAMDEI